MSDQVRRDASPPPKPTELSDLPESADDAVRGGATIEPCIRKVEPCFKPGYMQPCIRPPRGA